MLFMKRVRQCNYQKLADHLLLGLIKHAAEITAITNQWVNSYKRLSGGGEAPAFATWAQADRNAMVRIPTYKPKKEASTRIEVRSPDSACNAYLAFAVIIAAGIAGVEGAYELKENLNPTPLPSDLAEAISAMAKSELVKKTLGDDVFESVLRNKRAEWDDYRKQVSAYELNRYCQFCR